MARLALAPPASRLRRGPATVEQVGGGDYEEAETGDVLTKFVPGGGLFGAGLLELELALLELFVQCFQLLGRV